VRKLKGEGAKIQTQQDKHRNFKKIKERAGFWKKEKTQHRTLTSAFYVGKRKKRRGQMGGGNLEKVVQRRVWIFPLGTGTDRRKRLAGLRKSEPQRNEVVGLGGMAHGGGFHELTGEGRVGELGDTPK